MVTESWMSGSKFLVTICSESLGHHRISWSVWNERRNVIAASSPCCVGVEPGAAALFSRAVSAQGQALAELLCSVFLQVTESFLSKEVTCVVSSNREAKRGQARPREEKQNSPAAEGTKPTSSVPAVPKGTPTRARQKPPYTVRATKVLSMGAGGQNLGLVLEGGVFLL